MSFLEMLDVVNEELITQGRGADRVRLGLPRGHLRDVRPGDQRRAARPGPRRRPSASCTCGTSRTATRSRSSRGAPRRSRAVKDLIVDRSAFDRIIAAGGYVSVNTGGAPDAQRHPDPEATSPRRRWTRPPASAAAPAWRPARTRRRVLFIGAKISHLALLPQGQAGARAPRRRDGRRRWTPRASAAARTRASARRCARRRSPSRTSRGCGASTSAPCGAAESRRR